MELNCESINSIDQNFSLGSIHTNRYQAIAPWYTEQEQCNQIFQSKEFAEFREKDYRSAFTLKKEEDGSYTLESDHYIMRVEIENCSSNKGFCGKSQYALHFTTQPK
ncbi:MAG: hypothetical protein WCG10_08490 [Chlamydiota bacterium]